MRASSGFRCRALSRLRRRAGFAFAWAALGSVSLSCLNAQKQISGETQIRLTLEQLKTVGSVMMIAAHPDDENTALLAYFTRGRHVRTAYLALTRGEGGQNLIGSEQSDELGVIRTQELLAARRIDGAEQYFTRAIDFGFSKTADETQKVWPRDKVLGDIVWNIRRFRPDVIVLRFSGTPRDGHGHHQASAILGKEAFSAAADPTKYPEQLKYVQVWQTKRLLYNVATFTQERDRAAVRDPAPDPNRLEVDLGAYSPELGYSYGEIAGMSRSQHRSQGMGAAERKGSQKNYLLTIAGDKATKDVFEGIDISWSRLPGGAAVGTLLDQASNAFQPSHPEALISILAKAKPLIAAIHDPLAERKLVEIDEAIAESAGLWLEANPDKAAVTPGDNLKIAITAVARNPVPVALMGVTLSGMEGAPALPLAATVLVLNQPSQYSIALKVPETQPYSGPYWLALPKDGALYSVADPRQIGNADNDPVLEAHFALKVGGTDIQITRPVERRYVDRVWGELTRPLAVVPPVGLDLPEKALVFADTKPRHIEVPVKANTAHVSGDVHLELPAGWHAEPESRHFELAGVDQQTTAAFELTPPAGDAQGEFHAVAMVGDRKVSTGIEVIQYPHIPTQVLLPPAEAKLVRADIRMLAHRVGYIEGAGDEVPAALRQVGADVTLLSPEDVARGDLSRYDVVITGVRAFNTRADLRANYQRLFNYADAGGTVIVQYNVAEGGLGGGDAAPLEHIGPYPMRITRDRVTDEDAVVSFPNPQLPLLHTPNEITSKDFEGWVQERGLYFASDYDPRYLSVLESHDPGEQPMPGGMLYTKYGKGAYIFSAYDWFRELPAGVPGAYRLFANMMSAAKTQ